jgi:phosphoribosylformylglycinamidine synthase
MVGLIEDVRRVVLPGFKKSGDVIALLGTTQDDLDSLVPKLDIDRELAVQKACLEAAEAGLLLSAHDCSDGGLVIALAEWCFSSLGRDAIGAEVDLEGEIGPTGLLFSESPSRIVISFDAANANAVQEIAERSSAPFAVIGRVGGTRLSITINGSEAIAMDVSELESIWRNALSGKLQTEVAADLHG